LKRALAANIRAVGHDAESTRGIQRAIALKQAAIFRRRRNVARNGADR